VSDPQTSTGWIAPELASEFPELALTWTEMHGTLGPSPPELRARLRLLSDHIAGPQVLALRTQPVPWAYRVFFRHVGIDPDVQRTPVEALAVERLMRGEFPSRNNVDDALTIAVMETGAPVWALDAERLEPPLGIRPAAEGEPFPPGRLLIADAVRPIAVLFGAIEPGHAVDRHTTRIVLFSVQVPGVPALHVEEALWQAAEALG
jgi:hypothetical protein